jgi:hypothetical protein
MSCKARILSSSLHVNTEGLRKTTYQCTLPQLLHADLRTAVTHKMATNDSYFYKYMLQTTKYVDIVDTPRTYSASLFLWEDNPLSLPATNNYYYQNSTSSSSRPSISTRIICVNKTFIHRPDDGGSKHLCNVDKLLPD